MEGRRNLCDNLLRVEGRRRRGRLDLGREWRMRARDGAVETGGGEGSETGSMTEGKKNQ